jgi:hypothetical protein
MLVPEALEGSRTTSHLRSISSELPATDERDNGGSRRPQGSVREKSPIDVERPLARALLMHPTLRRARDGRRDRDAFRPPIPRVCGAYDSKVGAKTLTARLDRAPISPPRPGPRGPGTTNSGQNVYAE